MGPFPQDPRAEHEFDNRGDHLSLSPFLLEAFFKLSRRIVQSQNFDGRTVGIWQTFFAADHGRTKTVNARALGTVHDQGLPPAGALALLDRYTKHVHAQLDAGVGFTDAMKGAVSAVLSSPRFLYLYDQPATNKGAEPLDGYDLASRLSFLF